MNFIQNKDQAKKKFKIKIDLRNGKESQVIDTEYNLKEEILQRIFKILGLSYKEFFKTKKAYIDTHLLKNRNTIAHGDVYENDDDDEFSLTLKDLEKLKNTILFIMGALKEELSEYASEEYYLKSKASSKLGYENSREAHLENEFKKLEA